MPSISIPRKVRRFWLDDLLSKRLRVSVAVSSFILRGYFDMAIFCQWQEQISSTRSCQKSTLFFSGELCFQSILFLILPMVIQLSFYLSLSFKPSIRILASLKQELGPFCLVFVFVLFLSCFNFIFNSKKDDHQLIQKPLIPISQ